MVGKGENVGNGLKRFFTQVLLKGSFGKGFWLYSLLCNENLDIQI